MAEPLGPDYDDGGMPPPSEPDRDARMWAMAAHLVPFLGWMVPFAGNIVLPLIVWLLKREEHPFIDDQGKESVNFQITVTIAMAIASLTIFICIGVILAPLVGLAAIVLQILAAIQANNGVPYRYPFTLRLVK